MAASSSGHLVILLLTKRTYATCRSVPVSLLPVCSCDYAFGLVMSTRQEADLCLTSGHVNGCRSTFKVLVLRDSTKNGSSSPITCLAFNTLATLMVAGHARGDVVFWERRRDAWEVAKSVRGERITQFGI